MFFSPAATVAKLLLSVCLVPLAVANAGSNTTASSNSSSSFFIDEAAFTPGWSVLGGVLIGLSSVLYVFFTGRIVGISGILKNVVLGKADYGFRLAFIAGLLICGGLVSLFPVPSSTAFNISTAQVSVDWFPVSGILVGVGSSMQHGCTSGHGVCGVSRLSPKSIVLLLLFLAAGMLFATLIRPLHPTPQWAFEPPDFLRPFLLTGPFGMGIWFLGRAIQQDLRSLVALVCAAMFAAGLFIGGMTNTANIVSFLCIADVDNDSYTGWNPSLAFVMGGAILVAIAPFQYLNRKKIDAWPKAPLVLYDHEEESFGDWLLPRSWKDFTDKGSASVGAMLFGMGWSLSGMCPGPAIVAAGSGQVPEVTLFFLPFLVVGLLVGSRATPKPRPVKAVTVPVSSTEIQVTDVEAALIETGTKE